MSRDGDVVKPVKYKQKRFLLCIFIVNIILSALKAFVCFPPKQDGKLPFVPGEEEFIMGVSKYGIKVSTSDQYVSDSQQTL